MATAGLELDAKVIEAPVITGVPQAVEHDAKAVETPVVTGVPVKRDAEVIEAPVVTDTSAELDAFVIARALAHFDTKLMDAPVVTGAAQDAVSQADNNPLLKLDTRDGRQCKPYLNVCNTDWDCCSCYCYHSKLFGSWCGYYNASSATCKDPAAPTTTADPLATLRSAASSVAAQITATDSS